MLELMMRRILSQRRRMSKASEARSPKRIATPSSCSLVLCLHSAIYIFDPLWLLNLRIAILDVGLVIKTLASAKLPFACRSSWSTATCQQEIIMRATLGS